MDEQAIAHLESGCALIVGSVSDGNVPHAGRGWGLTVVATGPMQVRLLIDAADATTCDNARPGRRIAITSADVETLRSYQLKGVVATVDAATSDDVAKSQQYRDAFFGDIEAADRLPRAALDAWAPADVVAVVVEVDEWFSQTPGPGAGGVLPLPGGALR